MKKVILLVVMTLSLSGCGLEVWEGRVWSKIGNRPATVIYTTTRFSKDACDKIVIAKYNTTANAHSFDLVGPFGPERCKLVNYYGF